MSSPTLPLRHPGVNCIEKKRQDNSHIYNDAFLQTSVAIFRARRQIIVLSLPFNELHYPELVNIFNVINVERSLLSSYVDVTLFYL